MICTAKHPNDYHLLTQPKFNVRIYDCQGNIVANIDGVLPLDTIENTKDLEGIETAKNEWWEIYLYIREQENKQYREKGLI